MAENKLWYLVAYDVRDAKRLRRVAKRLESYGTRIQYSLFRCRMTDRELERLRWELSKFLANEDDLLIIGLCSPCVSRIRRKNAPDVAWEEQPETYEIL